MMLLYATFTFEASHSLQAPVAPAHQPQLHGHSYWARVWVTSSPQAITPLPHLEAALGQMKARLDHTHLNELIEGNPTMEALVDFIRQNWQGPELQRVRVWRESLGCGAEWQAQ